MYRIVAQSFRITQNYKQNKEMNNFTRGISTVGSGTFALRCAYVTQGSRFC